MQYIEKLQELGHVARCFDAKNILIKDYELPSGWQRSTTDLLLQIPPDHKNGIHGIQIPSTLVCDTDKKLSAPRHSNHYVEGWDLLSFRLELSHCDENILRNHMIIVKRVLSFQEHKA